MVCDGICSAFVHSSDELIYFQISSNKCNIIKSHEKQKDGPPSSVNYQFVSIGKVLSVLRDNHECLLLSNVAGALSNCDTAGNVREKYLLLILQMKSVSVDGFCKHVVYSAKIHQIYCVFLLLSLTGHLWF